MKLRVSRRGAIIGIVMGIGLMLSGIIVIQYTEAFFLVVILWIALPIMIVQGIRWLKKTFQRSGE